MVPEIAKKLETARLPPTYAAAKAALAECLRVDECRDWADQAAALASYARQADDPELENFARRIRLRAHRRMGELLRKFDGRGGDRSKSGETPILAAPSRAEVAAKAGLSPHKRLQAVRIANVAEAQFEALVESEQPPGTALMAQLGKATRPPKEELTSAHLHDLMQRQLAREVIEALLRLEYVAGRGVDLAAVRDLLDANPDKLAAFGAASPWRSGSRAILIESGFAGTRISRWSKCRRFAIKVSAARAKSWR